MKYRILRKNERPDKAKGDQYRMPSVRGDHWHGTSLRGKRTLDDCHRAGNPCEYRRPANGEAVGSARQRRYPRASGSALDTRTSQPRYADDFDYRAIHVDARHVVSLLRADTDA